MVTEVPLPHFVCIGGGWIQLLTPPHTHTHTHTPQSCGGRNQKSKNFPTELRFARNHHPTWVVGVGLWVGEGGSRNFSGLWGISIKFLSNIFIPWVFTISQVSLCHFKITQYSPRIKSLSFTIVFVFLI